MATLQPLPEGFAETVASLHRVAEVLVAPARKPDNEIALEATPGGFGTPEFEFGGARHQVRVEGAELVHAIDDGERRAPLTSLEDGADFLADLAPPTGWPLSPSGRQNATAVGGGIDDFGRLNVDLASSLALGEWYAFGEEVLEHLVALASDAAEASPVRLWPEHFDIAIELGSEQGGARANYGFSPGDENHAEPYAYVGPWRAQVSGPLWQARGFRGAEVAYSELLAAEDPRRAAVEFFMPRWDLLTIIGTAAE
jgi:hypothetical protein